jgi:hypothetical protein
MVKRHKAKSEYRFNLEIFKHEHDKEIKISNMPIDKLKVVAQELEDKYC